MFSSAATKTAESSTSSLADKHIPVYVSPEGIEFYDRLPDDFFHTRERPEFNPTLHHMVHESEYLVERGVRPLSTIDGMGHLSKDVVLSYARDALDGCWIQGVYVWYWEMKDGTHTYYTYGFTRHYWPARLMAKIANDYRNGPDKWVTSTVMGLLLGYGSSEINLFLARIKDKSIMKQTRQPPGLALLRSA